MRFEARFLRADGEIRHVEISSRIFDRERGLCQGVVRDVTERRHAQDALVQSQSAWVVSR